MGESEFGVMLTLLLIGIIILTPNVRLVKAERTLGVKAGDWIKYEFVTIVAAGGHPWMKLEVQDAEGTTVKVLWTTGAPSGASIPPGMPTAGLTVSWDVASGGGAFSYFIIHANAKVGDSVNVMGLPILQINGEATRTYAGASRTVVYASYSAFGLENRYYWDKETGVLLEYSYSMGGIELAIKAVETNLWQTGFGGLPLWVLGVIIAIIVIVTIAIIVSLRKKPLTRTQATSVGEQ